MTTSPPGLRPARLTDLHRIATLLTTAFQDDVALGDLIHPHRDRYPKDPELFWLRHYQTTWWNPRQRLMVSTTPNPSGYDLITGVAEWERFGAGGRRLDHWWWDPRRWLLGPALRLWARVSAWIWPNRALDPAQEDVFVRSIPFVAHFWSGPRAECWALNTLSVDPAYQGRGFGRALVTEGLERAAAEGCAASVISAPGKEPFYVKCGFGEEPVGRGGEGEGNPLADIPGGYIFFRDPPKQLS